LRASRKPSPSHYNLPDAAMRKLVHCEDARMRKKNFNATDASSYSQPENRQGRRTPVLLRRKPGAAEEQTRAQGSQEDGFAIGG
jgi:hypothetical protein